MCDIVAMRYEIETTNVFDMSLAGITDIKHRARIINRFDHIQLGNFGDHKSLGSGLFELRFFFGPSFRAHSTIKDRRVVFLLCGGDSKLLIVAIGNVAKAQGMTEIAPETNLNRQNPYKYYKIVL